MKNPNHRAERGQALILIVLAAVGLFAFAALAIDGSMVFSDRRHAQNAADTSVLAAALARVRGQAYIPAALNRSASNGYDNNGTTNVVEVYLCNDPAASCTALPAGADPAEYVQVKITSHVKMLFARVIGRTEVINRVTAVARAVPGYNTTLFGGNALVALNKTACPAFEYGGSSSTTVSGSGIFVNSSCASGSNQALNSSSGSSSLTVPCINVVGGVTLGTNATLNNPGTSCANNTNNPTMQMTDPMATFASASIACGTAAGAYNATTLNPGNYSGAFPPGNQTIMNPGIYCIDAGNQSFSLQGGQTLNGNNVLIYMKTGNISWTSGGINLSAIYSTDPTTGEPYPYNGLLLYMAPNNCSQISITGNGSSSFTGTILAPCSNVKLAGGSSAGTQFNNQIISDTITLSGSNSLSIVFDASQQWQPPKSPTVEMNQ